MLCRFLILWILLFLPLIVQAEQPAGPMPDPIQEYNLTVSFDVPNSKITGVAGLKVQAGHEVLFYIGELEVLEVKLNGLTISTGSASNPPSPPFGKGGILKINPSANGTLEIFYSGVFRDNQAKGDTNYGVTGDIIDSRGVSLTGAWYPRMDGLHIYKLKAALPAGYEAVSEAERIVKSIRDGLMEFSFEFAHPTDGVTFVASNRYEVVEDSFNGVGLYAYFFKEDAGLAKTYIEYTKKYLALYEKLLTRYPYKRFSIVENFLPTGYSMPAYTLLGQDVVRLPFIVETSLGHEILHQWFGNLVYTDYEKGNWAEGLTTYLADHLYEEQKGKGWEYRKQKLADYEAYVNEKNEFGLKDFRSRTDFPSKAIGYGKASMVFHMLKRLVGEEVFYKSLRSFIDAKRFKKASWEDLRKEFEDKHKKELAWFFKQWVEEKGLPDFQAEDLKLQVLGNKYEVSFNVLQKNRVYNLDVPLVFTYYDGTKSADSVRIAGEKDSFRILLNEAPETMTIDEDYDVARKLSDNELPPVIARLIGDETIIIALPVKDSEIYSSVIAGFKERGAIEKGPADIKDADIRYSSLVVLGEDNPLTGRLYGSVIRAGAGFSITVKQNPWNLRKVIGIVHAKPAAEADAAFRKIFHYGKYSVLSFDKGRNVAKTVEKSERGVKMELNGQAKAVDISAIRTVAEIIERISSKKIIYVGESHDNFAHHNIQLQVIKGLYKKNKKIAIGMEMFQTPFQKVLDEYIAGSLDERQFLKGAEYFKRWGFDYNLYKPIIDFARAEKIPVVALNVRREIVDKVSKGGMDSLSEEEKQVVPAQMDFSDGYYRDRLKEVFEKHKGLTERDFSSFYQSQVLWDETMSQSVDEFLKSNPDYQKDGQMIVLAGSGHLAYGSGIPKRTFRRNGYDYAIVLNDNDIEKNIADYVILPKPLDGVTAPKMMVILKVDDGRLKISGFPPDSVSEKAGLQVEDVIIAFDNEIIKDMDDLKIALFYKKKGDSIRVKVIRKKFLLGDREMEYEVTL